MLPSRPIIIVATRVESVWNAISWRSNISLTYSAYSTGTPVGLSIMGVSPVISCSAISMRRSISRIDERYSSSLRRSEVPRPAAICVVRSLTRSRMLRRYCRRRARVSGVMLVSMSPNRRSKTRRGLVSGGIGVAGPRHARLLVYAHEYPESQLPMVRESSHPSSSEREPRVLADVLGRDLVDRDAVLDVGAGGLARMHAGQVGRGGTGMVAGTVAERGAVPMPEAREDQRVLAERLERLHHPRVLEPGAGRRRGPLIHRDAVGHVRECQPDRRFDDVRRAGECGRHRIEHRQRDDGPHSLEERAARHVSARDDHGVAAPVGTALRDWKGRLLTISRTSAENL